MKLKFYTDLDNYMCRVIIKNSINTGSYFNYFMGKVEGDKLWLQRTSRFFCTRVFKGRLSEANQGSNIEGEFKYGTDLKIQLSMIFGFFILASYIFFNNYVHEKKVNFSVLLVLAVLLSIMATFNVLLCRIFGFEREKMIIDFL